MTYYVVVDVGCLECGESTTIELVTEDRDKAMRWLLELAAERGEEPNKKAGYFGYFSGGQHSVQLHTWEEP